MAWTIDGYWQRPKADFPIKPLYYVINEHELLLIVLDYYLYQMLSLPTLLSPFTAQQKIIPVNHIVKAGSRVPYEIIRLEHPRIKEIEDELAITADKPYAKSLMDELKQLKKELGYE